MDMKSLHLFLFLTVYGTVLGLPQQQNLRSGTGKWKTLDGMPTVLFAHRGEKVLFPEHTVPAYKTASILGADFVEPDLVLTKDNYFVCHHDLYLKDGTDVGDHEEFADRAVETSPGEFNWYIRNFTLEELKTLRVKQQMTGVRPQDYNGLFTIPTFEEYLQAVHEMIYKLNKTIGVVPELKNPAFHNEGESEQNYMEQKLLTVFADSGYPTKANPGANGCEANITGEIHPITCPPVIIQSFEFPALEYLKNLTNFDLLQLIDDEAPLLTYKGMEKVSRVAKYYSLWKEYLYVGVEADLHYNNKTWNQTEIEDLGGFVPPQEFPQVAHGLGMKIVLYTINDSHEKSTLGCAHVTGCEAKNKTKELDYFFDLGVDGVFIENVAESREILRDYQVALESSKAGACLLRQPFLALIMLGVLGPWAVSGAFFDAKLH